MRVERLRNEPIAFEDHTIPEYRPRVGLGRWIIHAVNPNANTPQEDHDVNLSPPGLLPYTRARSVARRLTLIFENVTLKGPVETFEPHALD